MIRERVLGLFAKWPSAGQVKTRLAEASSVEWATEVAVAFLNDILDRVAPVHAERLLVFTPDDSGPAFAELARDRFILTPQGQGDLGERLARFFAAHEGKCTIAIGSDSPTLPVEWISSAFEKLQHTDIVLGPATDGGYYLIGCRTFVPSLFAGIDWSSCQVLSQTVSQLGGASVALLPPWYDVDDLEDWQMLAGHVIAQRRAGIDPGVPRIEEIVNRRRMCRRGPPALLD
jgi:rSAM/selenodomain-associated transferase 1